MFECMTTPEHLTHFWGPVGVSTPIENITSSPVSAAASRRSWSNDASGAEYPSSGVYVEFDPRPSSIVCSEPGVEGGMTTSITFNDLGDGRTEVVTHQTNVPEMFRTPEAQEGMQSSFGRFDDYLATL